MQGPLNGQAAATGQQCPEGWTLHPFPGPNYKGAVENRSADSAYYNFVDRFDMLGVGKDVPLANGNLSEGLLAPVDGKFMTLRVRYPMGYYARGLDGRIDNPNGVNQRQYQVQAALGTRLPASARVRRRVGRSGVRRRASTGFSPGSRAIPTGASWTTP